MSATESIELDLVDNAGKRVGARTVPASVFDADPNSELLYQVVRWQRAKARSGTHSVLTRAGVRGGGSKPWRQKGTGRARAGSNTSPVWVGGGVAHGPKPRSYEFRLNKEERRSALCGALSARKREGRLILLSEFGLSEIKTKQARAVLEAIGVELGRKVLVVLADDSEIENKSLRNIAGVRVLRPEGLNVYDVLNADAVVIADQALEAINTRLN